ncbi:hypothetical protein GCM10010394_12800 [Streptomyces crystallinus]|uniref:Uncharacterized protein n=1 Tax=Streptomyces crystallinus TaxID=68191 RepID=A0ABN1F8Y0_9ACTN
MTGETGAAAKLTVSQLFSHSGRGGRSRTPARGGRVGPPGPPTKINSLRLPIGRKRSDPTGEAGSAEWPGTAGGTRAKGPWTRASLPVSAPPPQMGPPSPSPAYRRARTRPG